MQALAKAKERNHHEAVSREVVSFQVARDAERRGGVGAAAGGGARGCEERILRAVRSDG